MHRLRRWRGRVRCLPYGDPALLFFSGSRAVALRPRLTTGVPFSLAVQRNVLRFSAENKLYSD